MICEVAPAEMLLSRILPAFRPAAKVSSWDWICEHGRMPDGTPFDGERIPWCRGVCEAWDDPETREMSLMWGTRLGKTTIGMQLMAKCAATAPAPGLFATSTQSLAKRTVRNKIYPVLANCRKTADLLPAQRWWTVEEIRLSNSPWAVAWSGSDTQLADLSAFYGYANELDKWTLNDRQGGDAGEGDAEAQFLERFKEFYNAKILFECSPSTKRRSRIERRYLASNQCRYAVPCPSCGKFQVLKLGSDEPEKNGGILFDKGPDGHSDPAVARKTARYVCEHCRYEIHDDQRPKIMRRGVWVPAGCEVNKLGRLVGTPNRGPRLWGGQLSSLYSLQLRWGDIAEKFVTSKGDQRQFRMFVNGWLAETWEPYRVKSEPEQVGARLRTELPAGVVPSWATWLVAGVDRQQDHWVYLVVAVGPGEKTHVVQHGKLDTDDEVEEVVVRGLFEHEDGGEPLWPAVVFVDCGYRTKESYELCQRFRKDDKREVFPCKGANTDCAGEAYEVKIVGVDEGRSTRTKKQLLRAGRGLRRIRVNPYYYEPLIQQQLDDLSPGESGALSLNSDAADDNELLRQLCNGAESAEPSKTDPNRHLWVKRWESEPNDIRDCYKYARGAADFLFRNVLRGTWELAEQRQSVKADQARPTLQQLARR